MRNIYEQKHENQAPVRPSTTVKRILAIGNFNYSPSEDQYSEIYCPVTNNWRIFNDFQCERSQFTSVFLGYEIFILGGAIKGAKNVQKSVGSIY